MTKSSDSWSYVNQANWTTYQNFYSTIRTPINILTSKVTEVKEPKIDIHYKNNVPGTLVNEKLTPYFLPKTENNYVLYNSKKYVLKNYHIHCSSENSINDKFFPAEVHFVNQYTNPDNNQTETLIVSLLLILSDVKGLNIVNLDYEKIKNQGDEIDITINLSNINKLNKHDYFNFKGTLTLPPFIQNFNWNLFQSNDFLRINKTDFDNLIYYFSNNKANKQSPYNKARYINDPNNYALVKKIT